MCELRIENLQKSRAVREFVAVAGDYCALVERRDDYSRGPFLREAEKLLRLLNARVRALPDVEGLLDDCRQNRAIAEMHREAERKYAGPFGFAFPVSPEEWWDIFSSLRRKFGEIDLYDGVAPVPDVNGPALFDPGDPTSTSGSFSDDFADVYNDVKGPFVLYDLNIPESLVEAVWEWREQYELHWGLHLWRALSGLHNLRSSEEAHA